VQGQGEYTSDKEQRQLAPIINIIIGSMRNYGGHRVAVDLFSGCGVNHLVGIDGSPLILLRALAASPQPSTLICCEAHGRRRVELIGRLSREHHRLGQPQVAFHVLSRNDNAAIVAQLLALVPRREQRGLILSDPNGADHPLTTIRGLLMAPGWSRVDVLLNANASSLKWNRSVANGPSRFAPFFARWRQISLESMMTSVGKRYWSVTQPLGKQQWVRMFGTNWPAFPALAAYGFRPAGTAEAQEWLSRAERNRDAGD